MRLINWLKAMFNNAFNDANALGAEIALNAMTRFSEIQPTHLDMLQKIIEEKRAKKSVVQDESTD